MNKVYVLFLLHTISYKILFISYSSYVFTIQEQYKSSDVE